MTKKRFVALLSALMVLVLVVPTLVACPRAVVVDEPGELTAITVTGLTNRIGVINWTSDKLGTSQVEWGTTAGLGNTTEEIVALSLSHAVALDGLAAATTYHYRVKTVIPAEGEDDDPETLVSAVRTFKTADKVTYTVGVIGEIGKTKNPFLAELGSSDGGHYGMVYEPLLWIMDDGRALPGLAVAPPTYDAATKKFTFNLNPNAKFSNGAQVTAADVKWTLDKMVELSVGQTDAWRNTLVDTNPVVVVNPTTFTIEVKAFAAPFARQFGGVPILPKSVWEGFTTEAQIQGFSNDPTVGSGAWRLVDRVTGSHDIYEVRPDYWGEVPAIDRVVKKVYSTDDAIILALQGNDIDSVGLLRVREAVPTLLQNPNIDLYVEASNSTMCLYPNHRTPPWNVTAFRQAVDIGLNKQQILNLAVAGWGTIAPRLERSRSYPDVAPGALWPHEDKTQAERVVLANAALDAIPGMSTIAAGVGGVRTYNGNKVSFKLFTYAPFDQDNNAALIIISNLAAMGIEIDYSSGPAQGRVAAIGALTWSQATDATLADWDIHLWGRPLGVDWDIFADRYAIYGSVAPDLKRNYRYHYVGFGDNYSIHPAYTTLDPLAVAMSNEFKESMTYPIGHATRNALIASSQLKFAEYLPVIPVYTTTIPHVHRTERFTNWNYQTATQFHGGLPIMTSPLMLQELEPKSYTFS